MQLPGARGAPFFYPKSQSEVSPRELPLPWAAADSWGSRCWAHMAVDFPGPSRLVLCFSRGAKHVKRPEALELPMQGVS